MKCANNAQFTNKKINNFRIAHETRITPAKLTPDKSVYKVSSSGTSDYYERVIKYAYVIATTMMNLDFIEDVQWYKNLCAYLSDDVIKKIRVEREKMLIVEKENDGVSKGLWTPPENYPHHEGYWTWSDVIDQTVLVLKNPRHAIEEYHAICWDVNYATQYDEALDNLDSLYVSHPDVDDFIAWCDKHIFRKIKWWDWHIDH